MRFISDMKKQFSVKLYGIICFIFLVLSFLHPVAAEQMHSELFVYQFGVLSSWVKLYVRSNHGTINFLQGLGAKDYAGAAFYPQYILLSGLVVYGIILAVIVYRKRHEN